MAQASSSAITSVPCHLSGITRVCFSPDGSTIFTGGTDCLVRIHKADDPDAEPGFHDEHTDAVTSLSCSSSNLISASLDNIARGFTYPGNEFQGFITRSSGVPIRWVSVDKTGERVAVCSDDLLVKIVHIKDTSRVSLLSDNARSVRSATWDPQGKYLTTATCDGKINIYDMTASEPAQVKIMDGIIGSSESDSTRSCYVAWHPSGSFFAVPLRTNDIGVISREGWTKQAAFSHDGHRSHVSELAWSPNGRYLASSAGSQILVWSTESRQVIARYTNPDGAVSGLAFSPSRNLLAFTDLEGSFHRWADPILSDLPSPITSEAVQARRIEKLLDDEFGDDEDMEEKGEDLGENGEDDWIVDDDGGYGEDDGEKKWGAGRTEVVNVTKAQAAFVPGSTTLKNKKRYLALNMIGSVDITDQESHHVVNVEFHDRVARRGYHFQDHAKYTVASLGEQGIVYAARAEGDLSSTVHYRPYDSWASQSEWTISLPQGEDAVSVAAGGAASSSSSDSMGSVIVATSKGLVRVFSGSGIQRYVWRIGEEMVSMVGGKEMLLLVHREGGTSLDGCQNLRYTLMDLDTFDIVQEGRIPLPKRTILTWIGFTAEGTPAIFDSSGLLSILDRYRRSGQARWVPLLDSSTLPRKEGKQESYWPVGATSTHFTCVILKGHEKEPWFPRPLIQELEMHMPMLNLDNQQGKLEESVVRGEVHLGLLRDSLEGGPAADGDLDYTIKEREVALEKELLQLVQGACKADNLQRALDVTRLMHNPATIEAATKVAAFYHLPGLQERIQNVKEMKEKLKRGVAKGRPSRGTGVIPSSNGHISHTNSTKNFADFAPRDKPRRSFGGVAARDSTPLSTAPLGTSRSESYIPETPGADETPAPMFDDDRLGSPVEKRKRAEEAEVDEFASSRKRMDELPVSNGTAKNPFAKKVGANPFAKQAVARPLDSIKSTSFFERVDNIEASGATKASTKPKSKKAMAPEPKAGGKQTTLFGMKKGMAPPRPVHQDSMESTETEGDYEETMRDDDVPSGVLEESLVQESVEEEGLD